MAARENEGQVVKPAPAGKVSILMIIVVVLIITDIVDRPLEVLESPLGYVPALPPRRWVREVKWMPWTSTASWAASEKRLYLRGSSMASRLVLVNEKVLWSVPKKSASAPHRIRL
jgi:hypothetical protein